MTVSGLTIAAYATTWSAVDAADVTADVAPDRPPQMAITTGPSAADGPFAPITSPDVGEHCAAGLDAAGLTEFFSRPIGSFQGADYQRPFRLADDRVLWTFQDAFIAGTLVHNVGMIQSGRCFTMLNSGVRSWLLGDSTSHMRQWHWILDGGISPRRVDGQPLRRADERERQLLPEPGAADRAPEGRSRRVNARGRRCDRRGGDRGRSLRLERDQ